MTINLNHGYGNDFELDHLQDVDISKGVDRGGDYDNDDKIDDIQSYSVIFSHFGSYSVIFSHIKSN